MNLTASKSMALEVMRIVFGTQHRYKGIDFSVEGSNYGSSITLTMTKAQGLLDKLFTVKIDTESNVMQAEISGIQVVTSYPLNYEGFVKLQTDLNTALTHKVQDLREMKLAVSTDDLLMVASEVVFRAGGKSRLRLRASISDVTHVLKDAGYSRKDVEEGYIISGYCTNTKGTPEEFSLSILKPNGRPVYAYCTKTLVPNEATDCLIRPFMLELVQPYIVTELVKREFQYAK